MEAEADVTTRELPSLPSLAALLDRPLVVLDVGCRWGFEEKWRALGARVRLVGFDTDAAECQALRERGEKGAVRYVAAALGAAPGPARLFLTREPACSSLYPPDPELIAARSELACTSLVSTVEVELTTLDAWAAEAGVRSVDALKLDAHPRHTALRDACLAKVLGFDDLAAQAFRSSQEP